MTRRELMLSTLEFRNKEGRVPRQLWMLPWAMERYPEFYGRMSREFGWDLEVPEVEYSEKPVIKGDAYSIGEFTDEWGCTFVNIQPGVIGEVKNPQITDEEWMDADKVHVPEEYLSFDVEQVNEECRKRKDVFWASPNLARPFEQLQFIRGTVNLYMDLMDPPEGMLAFMAKMHDFYCRLFEKWAKTEVDALLFQDDWGSQQDLLISPELWEKYFMPMYKDYIDIAHRHGKKVFMHSDGNTLRILPKLIDMGLDAINTQIFCIGVDKLKEFKGKITFWGEIDRQYLLPFGTREEIDAAVQSVYDTLWQDGGCIAQCEFGPAGNPENVYRVFEKWNELR